MRHQAQALNVDIAVCDAVADRLEGGNRATKLLALRRVTAGDAHHLVTDAHRHGGECGAGGLQRPLHRRHRLATDHHDIRCRHLCFVHDEFVAGLAGGDNLGIERHTGGARIHQGYHQDTRC